MIGRPTTRWVAPAAMARARCHDARLIAVGAVGQADAGRDDEEVRADRGADGGRLLAGRDRRRRSLRPWRVWRDATTRSAGRHRGDALLLQVRRIETGQHRHGEQFQSGVAASFDGRIERLAIDAVNGEIIEAEARDVGCRFFNRVREYRAASCRGRPACPRALSS